MERLKGWWRAEEDGVTAAIGNDNDDPVSSLQWWFPRLQKLGINRCPRLTSFPSCPHVEEVDLSGVNEELSISEMRSCAVKVLRSDKIGEYKKCIPELIQGIGELKISWYEKESLWTVETMKCLQSCTSSLETLTIFHSERLKRVGRGVIEKLTNLRSLTIQWCLNYEGEEEEEEEEGIAWKSLKRLSSLKLNYLPKMESIAKGIQYLTALQSLHIHNCDKLERIPEWLSCLVSLRDLQIFSLIVT